MRKLIAVLGMPIVALAAPAGTASASSLTDFGIRAVGERVVATSAPISPASSSVLTLRDATRLGTAFGRITSTVRTAAHNRAVGGVPNSYHLRGRAIDIVRRAGVSHQQLAAALRRAGFSLIESLDEGDHSHFAFGFGGAAAPNLRRLGEITRWGIVDLSRLALPRE